MKPLGDKILVERDSTPDKTPGGLFLPENAKEKPSTGKVLAVGSGKLLANGKRAKMELKVGNKVLFNTYAAIEIPDNKTQVILREEDVLAYDDANSSEPYYR